MGHNPRPGRSRSRRDFRVPRALHKPAPHCNHILHHRPTPHRNSQPHHHPAHRSPAPCHDPFPHRNPPDPPSCHHHSSCQDFRPLLNPFAHYQGSSNLPGDRIALFHSSAKGYPQPAPPGDLRGVLSHPHISDAQPRAPSSLRGQPLQTSCNLKQGPTVQWELQATQRPEAHTKPCRDPDPTPSLPIPCDPPPPAYLHGPSPRPPPTRANPWSDPGPPGPMCLPGARCEGHGL